MRHQLRQLRALERRAWKRYYVCFWAQSEPEQRRNFNRWYRAHHRCAAYAEAVDTARAARQQTAP